MTIMPRLSDGLRSVDPSATVVPGPPFLSTRRPPLRCTNLYGPEWCAVMSTFHLRWLLSRSLDTILIPRWTPEAIMPRSASLPLALCIVTIVTRILFSRYFGVRCGTRFYSTMQFRTFVSNGTSPSGFLTPLEPLPAVCDIPSTSMPDT